MRRGHEAFSKYNKLSAAKDDARVQNEDAGTPVEGFMNGDKGPRPGQRYLNGPGKGWRLKAAHLGRQTPAPEDGPVCSERILSVAARRTCLVVFSVMRVSAAAPEELPARYFVSVWV